MAVRCFSDADVVSSSPPIQIPTVIFMAVFLDKPFQIKKMIATCPK